MQTAPPDLAQIRLDNSLALFNEFVRQTAKHADAATLRGLERRFAERLQIQPSYWSQIKGRSRQIGERLARQFEILCHKPRGWMDQAHGSAAVSPAAVAATEIGESAAVGDYDSAPRDDDERFIVGLVLTYYRRHPQRARTRLLDLLGEVLVPTPASTAAPAAAVAPSRMPTPSAGMQPRAPRPAPAADDPQTLWQRTRDGVAPLKHKK